MGTCRCGARAGDLEIRVNEIVAPFAKDKPYLGLVVGLVKPDGGTMVFGHGVVEVGGSKRKPDGKTVFEIGSVTKVFTAIMLADLVAEGVLRLDDPVQEHLPHQLVIPRHGDEQVTLLHLATHSSGLPIQPPLIGLFALTTKDFRNPYAEYGTTHLAKTLSRLKLKRQVGSRVEYSNLGIGVLGHALVRAAKADSYEALVVQRNCKPLGIKDTRIELSDDQQSRLAAGHTTGGKRTSPWDFDSLEGCGALRSTVNDMLSFASANLGLQDSSLQPAFKMSQQPRLETTRQGRHVGLCWMCENTDVPKRAIRWHNGGTGGYRSFVALDLDRKSAVVVLSNSAHSVDSLALEVLNGVER